MSDVAQQTQRPSGMISGPMDAATIVETEVDMFLPTIQDDPSVTFSVIRRKILEGINHGLHQENKRRKDQNFPGKVTLIQSLDENSIVKILLARRKIINVDLAEGRAGSDLSPLALYNRKTGLYETDEGKIKNLISRVSPTLSQRQIDSVFSMLGDRAPVVRRTTAARYIPVNNGIFDHTRQVLLPFSPDFVFLTKSPINYVRNALNPVIIQPDGQPWDVEKWIKELSDDDGVPELLWEITSAVLRPGVNFDQAAFLHSAKGNNGKGTFCAMQRNLLGPDGHTSIPIAKFDKPFALGNLVNARAIITDENPTGAFSKDLGDFKAIVTGDEFTLERKYKDPFNVSFNGMVIECVNDFPKSRDKSASYTRRQLFVPFRKWFGGDGVEKTYIKHEYLKRHDVLEYVMFRALSMTHTKFSNPPACQELLTQFQEENNPVHGFWAELEDEFVWDLLPTPFLYDLFKSWFDRNNPSGIKVSRNEFINQLDELLSQNPDWDFSDRRALHRPGSKMNDPEHLIADYDLKDWMNPGATNSNDLNRRCRPPLRQNYRGVLRVVAASGGDDDEEQDSSSTSDNDGEDTSDSGESDFDVELPW